MPPDGASRAAGDEEGTGVGDHSIGAGADLVEDGPTGAADGGGGPPERRTVAGLEETVHVPVLPGGIAATAASPASTADTISSRTSLTTVPYVL